MSRGATRVPPKQRPGDNKEDRVAAAKKSGGATRSKRGIGARLGSYFAHHRSSLATSFQRLRQSPLQTLLTSLVVAIALSLPTLLWLALGNLQALGGYWNASPSLTLFLRDAASDTAIEDLIHTVADDPRVAEHRYVSKANALAEFQKFSGFGGVLDSLSENPLPASIELKPAASLSQPAQQQALADDYAANPLVDKVLFDMSWVQRFLAFMALAKKLVLLLGVLLGLGALLAIGNTVRLVIESRRDEIVVVKLVGGTDGFVRRPLLYTGGLYGVFGSALCCVLVSAVLIALRSPLQSLLALYQSDFQLQGLGLEHALGLLVLGGALGWLGALLAVGRHLSEIEPR